MTDSYKKTGYLNSDFKLFHIIDNSKKNFDFHYHDFYKILIFLNGNVSYIVEGKQYSLHPNDIILINAGEIHKPVIHDEVSYDRVILYISPNFFVKYKKDNYDLSYCFEQVKSENSNLVRMSSSSNHKILTALFDLASSFQSENYAIELYQKVKLIEFLILLNQRMIDKDISYISAITTNPSVLSIIKYINEHLTEEISIENIAKHMYLNRSYIMHLFKSETGYTIGNYITEKRLFLARQSIANGISVTDACYQSGFKNYSNFYHAYKNKYHSSPKNCNLSLGINHIENL